MYSFQAKSETNKNKSQQQNSTEQQSNSHLIPFKIQADGPAQVKEYFESIMQEQKNHVTNELDCYKTSLYGRELLGKQIILPEGIQTHEFIRNSSNFEKIKFNEINQTTLYEWKHDEKPNNSDKLQSNVVYLSILSQLNKE